MLYMIQLLFTHKPNSFDIFEWIDIDQSLLDEIGFVLNVVYCILWDFYFFGKVMYVN